MRIALVHDDLVQWGGAERVLLGLCEMFPRAPIFTSVYDSTNTVLAKQFSSKQIITSFLQNIPGWRSLYKTLLPFYPVAFEQFNFDKFDLVISQTTRFAKSIITKPQTKHLCYCHTPPRFLWHLSGEKSYEAAEILMSKLRIYDQISARRVDYFIAGSENAKKRIKKIYARDSRVVYPFVDLNRFDDIEIFDGGYLVIAARPTKYKRVDLAQAACDYLNIPLKIISGELEDEIVMSILAGARALLIPGIEDFGLSSLEIQALGKPVIAYKAGGVLETVIEGKTGIFFEDQKVESLVAAIKKLESANINPLDCRLSARRFSKEAFKKDFASVVVSLVN